MSLALCLLSCYLPFVFVIGINIWFLFLIKASVLPLHFGLSSASREILINIHTTKIAKKLYNAYDKLM